MSYLLRLDAHLNPQLTLQRTQPPHQAELLRLRKALKQLQLWEAQWQGWWL